MVGLAISLLDKFHTASASCLALNQIGEALLYVLSAFTGLQDFTNNT